MNMIKTNVTYLQIMFLTAILLAIFAVPALAGDVVPLQESPPLTMSYTTSGAEPVATMTYTNYYVAEGTKITPPTAISFTDTPSGASERISLVPNAGKGTPYVKPRKLKIHESRYEFEKHVKQKHGKRYQVEEFRVEQAEGGLDSFMYIVENRDESILQLGEICTETELAHRIAVAKDFVLNNPELIGLTENEELRVRGLDRNHCRSIYFDVYVNEYELYRAQAIFTFVPQNNFNASFQLKPITPEMYAAAQADALSPEEIARIVYQDMNIPIDGKDDKKTQKLQMRKYLRNEEPYAYWDVRGRYIYYINAITGEIIFKQPNVKK